MKKMVDSVKSIEQGVMLLREIMAVLKADRNRTYKDKEEYRTISWEVYCLMQRRKGRAHEEAENAYKEFIRKRTELLSLMPSEILETVDDMELLALGFLSGKTRRLMKRYLKKRIRSLDRLEKLQGNKAKRKADICWQEG